MSAPDAYRIGAWFVAYTVTDDAGERRDYYYPVAGEDAARERYREILRKMPDLYCACIGPITEATEPHWLEPSLI